MEEAVKPKTRWLQLIPAVTAHVCLGAPYAWSVFNAPLTAELGVVASSSDDWTLASVVPVISAVFAVQGLSAALLGKWMEPLSPRLNGIMSAVSFGGGFMLGGLGVYLHSLPLLYLGYGVLGGVGIGLGYVPAVKNLMGWFPDKAGFASGMTICGFGGAALLAAPAADSLMKKFARAPTYLGSQDSLNVITHLGNKYVEGPNGDSIPVVIANANDIASSAFPHLLEGVYVVGSGSTGVAETLGIVGALYFTAMGASALSYRTAPAGFAPAGWTPPVSSLKGPESYVPIDNVMKTPQFWLCFTILGSLATSGLAVASVAKTMILEIFGASPLVTAGFASGFIMSLSIANLGGRLGWASLSDKIGRKRTFQIMTVSSIPLYLIIAYSTQYSQSALALAAFYASSLIAFSSFGAAYSIMPALESDLFGKKAITATHGRMLLASSTAAIVGPSMIVKLRSMSEASAIRGLADRVDEATFLEHFGSPMSQLGDMIAQRTITIKRMMEVMPEGTMDPTAFLYNNTMYVAASIMGLAAVSATMLGPVNDRFKIIDSPEKEKEQVLPVSDSGHVYVVAVDGSLASESAFAWALTQVNPEKDTLVPFAVVSEADMENATALLHRHHRAAERLGVETRLMFCPTSAVGPALSQVCRQLKPHALIVGKSHEHPELANYLSKYATATDLLVFVAATPRMALEPFDDVPVAKNVDWSQVEGDQHVEEHDPRAFLRDPFDPKDKVFEAKTVTKKKTEKK